MNTGCYARKLWAYKWIEKVARAPNKKLISLIQTKFFASCLLFISVMISNDRKKIIKLSLLLRHFKYLE